MNRRRYLLKNVWWILYRRCEELLSSEAIHGKVSITGLLRYTRKDGIRIYPKFWRRYRRSFTLIELTLSILIISICLIGTILAFITVAKFNADPLIQQQAINIGKSYLEEIMAKSFPQVIPCPAAPAGGRAVFASVCDYQGLNDIGARDQDGQVITGLSAYTVQITIDTASAILGGINPGTDVVRIDVSVTHQDLQTAMVLSGYRTKY